MTRYAPLWEQQQSYAASVDRRLIAAAFPTPVVSGCLVSVSSGMTVNVAAGTVVVPTSNNTGSVLCVSDATEPVTLAAAPGSGSNRYDLVICQARGNDLDGGTNNDFLFTTVTGTAAASPTVPAVPNNALAFATIYVPGGSASVTAGNITDTRPMSYTGRRIGYIDRTNSPAQASAEQVVLTLAPIFVPVGRIIRVEAGWWNCGTNGDGATQVHIREGTTVAGTSLVGTVVNTSPTGVQGNTGSGGTLGISYAPTGLPAAKQWVLTCVSANAQTVAIQGGSGIPIYLAAYDVGP